MSDKVTDPSSPDYVWGGEKWYPTEDELDTIRDRDDAHLEKYVGERWATRDTNE